MVSSALNVASLDELAQVSRAKPGTLSYSALAISMQITIENWKKKTGADLVYVPVRGGGDMVNGLLTTLVASVGLPNFIPYIRTGTVKALAVDSETRSALFPDVPALRARISKSRAGLFCLCRSGGHPAGDHYAAARRDRGHRQRAGFS